MIARASRDHQRARQALSLATARAVIRLWRSRVDPRAPRRSWLRALAGAVAIVARSQREAVGMTGRWLDLMVPDALRTRQDGRVPPIVPDSFVGRTAGGDDLADILALPGYTAQAAVDSGRTPGEAMARGEQQLQRLARTIVSDTGRAADMAAMAGDRRIRGYVRVVELPACARCIILAGRFYSSFTEPFLRHPQCDCTMQPVYVGQDRVEPPDPYAIFNSLSRAEQDRLFGARGAQTIRDGGDIFRVVNARRGMSPSPARRRTGTSRRRRRGPQRPSVETLRRIARDDDHLANLLAVYGYIPLDAQRVPDDFRNGGET